MGQYRLWLHYREADQQLHGKLAALEQELLALQQQVPLSEYAAAVSYADNTIVQALLTQHSLQAEKLLAQASARLGTTPLPVYKPENTVPTASAELPLSMPTTRPEPQGGVSSALQAWGGLPNLSAQDMQAPIEQAKNQAPYPLSINQQDQLLPEDISAFVDGYSMTDPQIKLPWWLRKVVQPAEHTEQGQISADQQSLRTNHLVQRWFDRWGQREEQAQEDGQVE